MTGTVIVLVISLICLLLVFLVAMVAVPRLAKRNGLTLKKMSVSLHRGITAEFYEPSYSVRKKPRK